MLISSNITITNIETVLIYLIAWFYWLKLKPITFHSFFMVDYNNFDNYLKLTTQYLSLFQLLKIRGGKITGGEEKVFWCTAHSSQLTVHSSQLTAHSSRCIFFPCSAYFFFFGASAYRFFFFSEKFPLHELSPHSSTPLRLFLMVHPLHRERANEANKMLRKRDYSPSSFKHITQTRLNMIMKEKKTGLQGHV